MKEIKKCEYCGRLLKDDPTIKVLRGIKHTFCTEFCFRLYFYDVPHMSFEDLQKMYALRCVSIKSPDFRTLIYKED
jgi:hypothetical protein